MRRGGNVGHSSGPSVVPSVGRKEEEEEEKALRRRERERKIGRYRVSSD